jgi:hypothetical protein
MIWEQFTSLFKETTSSPSASCKLGPRPDSGQQSTILTAALARSSEQYEPTTACSTQPRTATVTSARSPLSWSPFSTNTSQRPKRVSQSGRRNHPSWENNAEAQEVLILVLSEWFNAGSLECVERLHRFPHCILAVGRVPKNTAPLHRPVTDARAINIYAESWRVKYATVGDIYLMLTICALIWIRDLKNTYHLVRLGGCRSRTEKLLRWITNHDCTGYVPAPTFRS